MSSTDKKESRQWADGTVHRASAGLAGFVRSAVGDLDLDIVQEHARIVQGHSHYALPRITRAAPRASVSALSPRLLSANNSQPSISIGAGTLGDSAQWLDAQ